MILEYRIDYRSSSTVYEKIFLKTLDKCSLIGKIIRDNFILKCYVEADSSEELESFSNEFTSSLPNSIFLYDTKASMVQSIPEEDGLDISRIEKLKLPFCLDCLDDVNNKGSKDYYNIYKSCDICGYSIEGEEKNYKKYFQEIARKIKTGALVNINTFYGNYTVGLPSKICNDIKCDLISYDYATLSKYMVATEEELQAIASFEKPFIRLKTELKFALDYESVEKDLFRCKLADDFVLYFLMHELNYLDENIIFITKENISADEIFKVVSFQNEIEPIEMVISKTHKAIIRGKKGLPEFPLLREEIVPSHGALLSVVHEHKLDFNNFASLYVSKEHRTSILVYGKKYGFINYIDFKFKYDSIKSILDEIAQTDETTKKLLENYNKKFVQHVEKINTISWDNSSFSIYELWGVCAIILGLTKTKNLQEAAQELEDNNIKFLGKKGPRIDYKLIQKDSRTELDPLKVIRSAMSFKLAGIDDLTLSYGIMESFVEFISHEFDVLKESMGVEAISISGSMLQNKKLFSRLCKDSSINHKIYIHNELIVDGDTIFK